MRVGAKIKLLSIWYNMVNFQLKIEKNEDKNIILIRHNNNYECPINSLLDWL